MRSPWSFYGRRVELSQLQAILARRRWFFLQISGRRRIGKTTLIQEALSAEQRARTLYLQIPDSDPVGVVAACNGYLETFGRPERVSDLGELARLVARLAEAGHIVAIDEFQYFHRKPLGDFCSLLQAEVDRLAARASEISGGLIVLGSLHAEMTALLENRDAPLFNRTTDRLDLGHLDTASILEILRVHADTSPQRLLFLWNLFEGVPKFYRDAYEQDVLGAERRKLLQRLFFASSSPLRGEADNWFLRELRGRYDMVLQHLAKHPGCTNAEIEAAIAQVSRAGETKQIGGYLKILTERYRMIERKLPTFSPAKARSGRYYIRDNFLRAWLSALQRPVSATAFRPLEELITQADERLATVEGHALEALAGQLYEERSRLGLGDFPLSDRIHGYWDRGDVEIDLVAVSEPGQRIRFGTCRRNPEKLLSSLDSLRSGAGSFIQAQGRFRGWRCEFVAIAPEIAPDLRHRLQQAGVIAQDLHDLTAGL
ncbi:MAG: ATP-binding protein [Puniceicoccales bacterium]|jgi:AAA+ ATPase superfamily predicted ATPase|nr:ATP-binding protein [Puniceicoccales bacterium]